jgi:hypothetical protein
MPSYKVVLSYLEPTFSFLQFPSSFLETLDNARSCHIIYMISHFYKNLGTILFYFDILFAVVSLMFSDHS